LQIFSDWPEAGVHCANPKLQKVKKQPSTASQENLIGNPGAENDFFFYFGLFSCERQALCCKFIVFVKLAAVIGQENGMTGYSGAKRRVLLRQEHVGRTM
jgi:hypothetical protein